MALGCGVLWSVVECCGVHVKKRSYPHWIGSIALTLVILVTLYHVTVTLALST